MPHQTFVVGGPLPGLNDLLAAAKRFGGAKNGRLWNGYCALKREWGQIIVAEIKAAKIKPCRRPVWLYFEWREPNRKRDPDGVSSGGKKLILDSLVIAGVLKGDGWQYIAGWTDVFVINRAHPGVRVVVDDGVVAGP